MGSKSIVITKLTTSSYMSEENMYISIFTNQTDEIPSQNFIKN
jgi:hypothetical protein